MRSKSVLVTGCAGFIGSHLSYKLLECGYKVIGLDNYDDYYDVELKKQRVRMLRQHGLDFVEGSVLDTLSLEHCFERRVDGVVHLAAKVGVRHSFIDPTGYMTANVLGTMAVTEAAVNHKVEQFVLASSSSVYGSKSGDVASRETDADGSDLLSPYAVSKRSAELWSKCAAKVHGLPTTVLRFFTVYGTKGRPDMLMAKIFNAVKNNETLFINGDGEAKRDFTHVDDIVDGIILSLSRRYDYEEFNLGAGNSTSIHDVIRTFEEVSGRKIHVKYIKKQLGDVSATWANIEKAKDMLGWKPKIFVDDAIRKM